MTNEALTVAAVCDEARQRAGGLDDVDGGQFTEGLERFVAALNAEAELNDIGRLIASERAVGHVTNRLRYVDDRRRHPDMAAETIERPVFIIGMPRTGTTILHDILGQDPANRTPMTWEVMFPSPPPEADTFSTDARIAACDATFPSVDLQIPAFKAMHPMGATLSQECVTMMGESMVTPLFHNQFRVPSYQDWVDDEADWTAVYTFHHTQLQHLQWHNRRDRWVLKTGAHLWGLARLLKVYPDARIVFTHRDPVKSMTSYASLTSLVRSMGSDRVDPVEVAEDWTGRLRRMLMRGVEVRRTGSYPDAVFYDMYFPDFIADQFAEVEKIYDALGLPLHGEAADAMRVFIADNPPGRHGIHRYAPEEFGVDPQRVRAAFGDYIDHFSLAPEEL
ncbi:MAG: sulfotransferase family protein [Acidimicrobiales bacterium]